MTKTQVVALSSWCLLRDSIYYTLSVIALIVLQQSQQCIPPEPTQLRLSALWVWTVPQLLQFTAVLTAIRVVSPQRTPANASPLFNCSVVLCRLWGKSHTLQCGKLKDGKLDRTLK
ncbi:hypothetical protein P7K49_009272 [Saguinus oedipus]|uniref:Uncharacterized protein n=1 Tax=Saguinus oedipus TaxID=9490 RepID=A0ABQ9VJG9_SAGOE|nr:hypothetical protein P7K49_009272 [Saguinus oedipus]